MTPGCRRTAIHGAAVGGVLAGVLLALAGCGGGVEPEERATDGRLVWVSGRDDHGLVATEEVALRDGVDGRAVASVRDGVLVTVLDGEGQWLKVRTAEGAPAVGWVDDFRLRGELRLVGAAPSCRSTVGRRAVEGGTLVTVWRVDGDRALVETVAEPRRRGWAPRDDLQELPAQGEACGQDPPGARHRH